MAKTLSVVIPAYNEEARLPATLERVVAYLRDVFGGSSEIVVVNDGSSDSTAAVAREAAARLSSESVHVDVRDNPANRGKGYSVRHGMLTARHEWVLFTDADLSAPIGECDKLFQSVKDGSYDIAIGSRALDRSLIGVHQPRIRETLGRFFNLCVRLGTGLPFADTQCGFKLFSRRSAREIFSRQQLERFGFDVEVLYLAKKLGFQVVEVPVRWDHAEGTKVSTLSGANAFLDVWRVRRNDWTGKYE